MTFYCVLQFCKVWFKSCKWYPHHGLDMNKPTNKRVLPDPWNRWFWPKISHFDSKICQDGQRWPNTLSLKKPRKKSWLTQTDEQTFAKHSKFPNIVGNILWVFCTTFSNVFFFTHMSFLSYNTNFHEVHNQVKKIENRFDSIFCTDKICKPFSWTDQVLQCHFSP